MARAMTSKETFLISWGITLILFAIVLWLPVPITMIFGLISLLVVCRIGAWFIVVEIEDQID